MTQFVKKYFLMFKVNLILTSLKFNMTCTVLYTVCTRKCLVNYIIATPRSNLNKFGDTQQYTCVSFRASFYDYDSVDVKLLRYCSSIHKCRKLLENLRTFLTRVLPA